MTNQEHIDKLEEKLAELRREYPGFSPAYKLFVETSAKLIKAKIEKLKTGI